MKQKPTTLKPEDLKRVYIGVAILGGFMVMSIFFYVGICEFMKRQSAATPFDGFVGRADYLPTLKYILLAVSVVEIALIGKLKKFLTVAAFKKTQGDIELLGKRLTTISIVIYALCESIAIFGLALFIIGGDSMTFYLFFMISLAAFVLHFPRIKEWQSLTEQSTSGAVNTGPEPIE